VSSLGNGVLLVLALVFAAVTVVFVLGFFYGVVHGALIFIVPQAVMALAFGLLDVRLWRILRERRARC
jgi:hypothetical protein